MSAIDRLQREFQTYLLDPAADAVKHRIVGTEKVSAEVRLGIYADAYRLRLLEALATDFPAVRAFAGADEFDRLGRAYIDAHPSSHFSLRWFARDLERFLRETPPYREHPQLAELAAFEWAMTLVFDAPDRALLTVADMATIPAESWADLRLEPHPAVQRLDLHWNVPIFWKAVDADQEPEALQLSEVPIAWVLWRQELKTYFRSLAVDEAYALDAVRAGRTFADICQGLCEWVDEAHVAVHAAGLLKRWIMDGLIHKIAV